MCRSAPTKLDGLCQVMGGSVPRGMSMSQLARILHSVASMLCHSSQQIDRLCTLTEPADCPLLFSAPHSVLVPLMSCHPAAGVSCVQGSTDCAPPGRDRCGVGR